MFSIPRQDTPLKSNQISPNIQPNQQQGSGSVYNKKSGMPNFGIASPSNVGAQSNPKTGSNSLQNKPKTSSYSPSGTSNSSIISTYNAVINKQQLNADHIKSIVEGYKAIIYPGQKDAYQIGKMQLIKNVAGFSRANVAKQQRPQQYQLYSLQLWGQVTKYFIHQYPFCPLSTIIELLTMHINQNKQLYLEDGKFSKKFVTDNQIYLFTATESISNQQKANVNKKCETFKLIIKQLQGLLKIYCKYINATIANLSEQQFRKLGKQTEDILLNNMCSCLKTITGFDDKFTDFNNNSNNNQQPAIKRQCSISKIRLNILECFSIILKKDRKYEEQQGDFIDPILFNKNIVQNFVKSVDSTIQFMQQDQKKQVISICCITLLRYPYFQSDWKQDKALKDMVLQIKSKYIKPFQWLLNIFNHEQENSRNQPFFTQHSQTSVLLNYNITEYHLIEGLQWLQVAKVFIGQLQKSKQLQINQQFQAMLFNLVCSIISENPHDFWANYDEYSIIYSYIAHFGETIAQNKLQNGTLQYQQPQTQQTIGKFIRLMICCCSKDTQNEQKLETGYVIHNFVSNILNNGDDSEIIDEPLIYTEIILPYIVESNFKNRDNQNSNQTNTKYHIRLPQVAQQLLIKLITDQPKALIRFCTVYNAKLLRSQRQIGHKIQDEIQLEQLLYTVIFSYLQNLVENKRQLNRYQIHQQLQQKQQIQSDLGLGKVLQLINVLCTLPQNNEVYKKIKKCCISILNKVVSYDVNSQILNYAQIRKIFEDLVTTQKSTGVFSKHIICLYENGYQNFDWITRLCLPLIHEISEFFDASSFKHYINIFSSILKKNLFEASSVSDHMEINNIILQERTLRKTKTKLDLLEVQIRTFLNNQERILLYINWALRIEENQLHPHKYFNILFEAEDFDILNSALNLLQMLMDLYLRFENEYYIPTKLQGFFSIFKNENKHQGLLSQNRWTKSSKHSPYNILITNNKLVTVPGAIAYLITSNKFKLNNQDQDGLNADKIKQQNLKYSTLKTAMNIMSLIVLYHQRQSIETDFRIYKSFYIDDFNNVYCSADTILINHLIDCLKSETVKNTIKNDKNLYGETLDLLMLLIQKDTPQKWVLLLQIVSKKLHTQKSKINIKQAYTLSRFLLILVSQTKIFNSILKTGKNIDQSTIIKRVNQITDKIMQIICYHINATLKRQLQKSIMSDENIANAMDVLVANFFKALRLLQLKQNNGKFYSFIIQKYLPTILNNKLFQINCQKSQQLAIKNSSRGPSTVQFNQTQCVNSTIQQYFIALELTLCCKTYLNASHYLYIIQSSNFARLLILFVESVMMQPQYYLLGMYALRIYADIQKYNFSTHKKQTIKLDSDSSSISKKHTQLNVLDLISDDIFQIFVRSKKNSYQKLSFIAFLMVQSNLSSVWKSDMEEFCTKFILSWNRHNFIDKIVDQSRNSISGQIIQEAILLNVIHNPTIQTIKSALQMGEVSAHCLTYVSVMNHLYNAIISESIHSTSYTNHINFHTTLLQIMDFAEQILKMQLNPSDYRKSLYMKSWSCNILNAILASSTSQSINCQFAQIMFYTNIITGPLSQLLENYAGKQLGWQYSARSAYRSKNTIEQGLGILQKQLLFSLLKLVSTFMANYQYWQLFLNKKRYIKSSLGQDQSQKNRYNIFCRSIVQSSIILNPLYTNNESDTFKRMNPQIQNQTSKNAPQNNYQKSLQSISIQTVIGQSINQNTEILKKISTQHLKLFQSTYTSNEVKKNQEQMIIGYLQNSLFFDSPNCLDFVHEYMNTLIQERFVMIMFSCYQNKSVGILQYEYLLKNMEKITKKLLLIEKQQTSYQKILQTIDQKVWKSSNMTDQLYYLNYIEQSVQDYVQLLNDKLQMMMSCCNKIKTQMQLHKDYKSFYQLTSKIMKYIKTNQNVFRFDVGKYYNDGKFGDKSQYGQSFVSASMRYR